MRTAAMMSLDSSVTDSIVLTNEKINNNMANYDEVTTQLFLLFLLLREAFIRKTGNILVFYQ